MDRTERASRRQGFTLIELLVVIGIIGLLAAIIVPALNGALGTATKARAMQMCRDLQGACQRYFAEYNRMPVPPSPKGPRHGEKDVLYSEDNKDVVDILILSEDVEKPEVVNARSIRFQCLGVHVQEGLGCQLHARLPIDSRIDVHHISLIFLLFTYHF